jgi:hypothetical protein
MSRFAVNKGLAALALATVATASQAVVAFDNFGPGDTYNTGVGWTVAGSAADTGPIRLAFQFTSGASGMLDKIILPVQFTSGTNKAAVILRNDSGGVLGNWILSSLPGGLPNFGSGAAPLVITNPFTDPNLYPHLVLNDGSDYWLEVAPDENVPGGTDTGADSKLAWNLNSIGDLGYRGSSTDNGATYEYMGDQWRGAFRVELVETGTGAVPGPMAALPFVVGLLAARRRRK